MGERKTLLLAALLFLLALLKLLFPGQNEALRVWASEGLGRELSQTAEAWGRGVTGMEERIAALGQEAGP